MMVGAPIDSVIVLEGVPSKDLTLIKIIKIGYTFEGWCTDNTLLSPFDISRPISGNMMLYAKWKYNFTGTRTDMIKSLDGWLNTYSIPHTVAYKAFDKTPLSKEDAANARELMVRDATGGSVCVLLSFGASG